MPNPSGRSPMTASRIVTPSIQPIVEGHGEVAALPVLLRRLLELAQVWDVRVRKPIREQRSRLAKRALLERVVQLARTQEGCRAILIVLDGDRDCPAELGPRLLEWAAGPAADTPCEVVIAHREYEAWFLASLPSLRGVRGIRPDTEAHPDPEAQRGAKEALEARMAPGLGYLERTDQPALSAEFSLPEAYRASRSFRKLTASVRSLVRGMGREFPEGPPDAWPGEREGGVQSA